MLTYQSFSPMNLVYERDVRPFIATGKSEWADALFYFHTRSRVLLRHEGGQACFFDYALDKWINLNGVTGVMKREIWKRGSASRTAPKSAVRSAMKRSAARVSSRIYPRSTPRTASRRRELRGPLQRMPGFMQGTLVHRQI